MADRPSWPEHRARASRACTVHRGDKSRRTAVPRAGARMRRDHRVCAHLVVAPAYICPVGGRGVGGVNIAGLVGRWAVRRYRSPCHALEPGSATAATGLWHGRFSRNPLHTGRSIVRRWRVERRIELSRQCGVALDSILRDAGGNATLGALSTNVRCHFPRSRGSEYGPATRARTTVAPSRDGRSLEARGSAPPKAGLEAFRRSTCSSS